MEFINQKRTGDKWLDQALGYVLFASKEKHLFRCINDERHTPFQKQFAKQHWAELGEKLSEDERFQDLHDEIKQKVRVARWFFVHGLAYLIANGWLETPTSEESKFSDEMGSLIEILRKINHGLLTEFKKN